MTTSSRSILGMRVDGTSLDDASRQIIRWARRSESRYVCVAAVNNVMQARDNAGFRRVMNDADLVTPDGTPLVWGLRRLGVKGATRVYGPDLMPLVLALAEREGLAVGFYGGDPRVLEALVAEVASRWPDLKVAYAHSPPYRHLTAEEDGEDAAAINGSGARILFVGLGCPKQETWMASHRGRITPVMVGVGAAFDYLAAAKRQAPEAVRNVGLEWLFRLVTEPRRLAGRYLRQNPRFALLFAAQMLRARFTPSMSTQKETP